ncbi:MAG: 60S ribosomal export protein NMD3 [Candidatus Diapherotrites archaeon]
MNEFCPRCGSTEGPFFKGFCQKCFLGQNELIQIEPELRVKHCTRCGRVQLTGRWQEQESLALAGLVKSKVKPAHALNPSIEVELIPLENGSSKALIEVEGEVEGKKIVAEKEVLVKPEKTICDACMRLSSDYREAVLQVRFEETPSQKRFDEMVREVEGVLMQLQKKDALAKAVKISKEQKGVDFWIGSKRGGKIAAEKLAKKYSSKVVRSSTLTGVDKKGKAKKRFTFCVRVK